MTETGVACADGKSRVLVIGHSHMHALTAIAPNDPRFEFVSCWDKQGSVVVEKPLSHFESFKGRRYEAVVFMVGGNQHITLGLVRQQPSLDFYLPEEPALSVDTSAMLLPAALVQRCLRRRMEPELQFITALISVFAGSRLFQVESPPPLPSAYVVQYPHNFSMLIERFGVSPFGLRYKLWRVQSRIAREYSASSDIAFIPSPPQAQDGDGSLNEAFRRQDPTHANAAYGSLVLDQIRCRLFGNDVSTKRQATPTGA